MDPRPRRWGALSCALATSLLAGGAIAPAASAADLCHAGPPASDFAGSK